MSKCRIIEDIRRLNIPARAKAELLMLYAKARHIVEKLIAFLHRHREFAETLLIGAIIAFLLAQIPWIGGFLALCALVSVAAVACLNSLRADIERLFEPIPA